MRRNVSQFDLPPRPRACPVGLAAFALLRAMTNRTSAQAARPPGQARGRGGLFLRSFLSIVAVLGFGSSGIDATSAADKTGGASKPKEGNATDNIEAALKEAQIKFETDSERQIISVEFGSPEKGALSVAHLKLVAKIKTLKSLGSKLSFDNVSNDKLAAIGTIKSLESLTFDCCNFQGNDLKKLAVLPKLTKIAWTDSTIDDAGAKSLSTIKTLTILKLDGNQISDFGVKALGNLKDLTELSLAKNIGDRQAAKSPPITDAALVSIKGMKQLKVLNLSGNSISDAGLKQLTGMMSLETIRLADTKVTPDGIAKFNEALPGCKVEMKNELKE